MSRPELVTGYVLHSRPYRDSSMLVEYFSRERGRISLVAKGAKGRKTRGGSTAALLQPFTRLSCSWSGRSDLKTLVACESLAAPIALMGSRLFSGMYVNELLVRLIHHEDPHELLFDHYELLLSKLAKAEAEEPVLRRFEFLLLDELGYGFDLSLDGLSGEPIEPEAWYHYHQEYGLVRADEAVSERIPRFLGRELQLLEQGDYEGGGRGCAKRLMRHVLSTHLGEKPLKSRELFRQL